MPTLVNRMIRRITREGHLSGFTDEQVLSVLRDAKQSLEPQPAMLEIDAPILIFGDIHGQLRDLLRFFTIVGPPPQNKILFLGDYVDRCKKSFEVIMLLLCYRIKYPHLIYFLRGNHECSKMNRLYGFYEEMRRKRNVYMWKKFQEVFNEMPLCALVSGRLLCMHGGISPEIQSWDALVNLKTRATSYIFGGDTIANICSMLDISLVVRAHEVVKGGHQFMFDRKLITVFSAPNYCGTDGNAASVMKVSRRLEISFITLKPRLDTTRLSEEKRLLLEKMIADAMAKSPDPYNRPSATAKNGKNAGTTSEDSSLIGPPPVLSKDKVDKQSLSDINEWNTEKQTPTNQPNKPLYSYSPLATKDFIKGVQAGTNDTSFNKPPNVLFPKKRDTTPSPSAYPKSSPDGVTPSPANSGNSKPTDMLKSSSNDSKNVTPSATTTTTGATPCTTPIKSISSTVKTGTVPHPSKPTTPPIKSISPNRQISREVGTRNNTQTETSSISSEAVQHSPLSAMNKPQSVAEATKGAIASTKTPPRPHPKSPNEIISATEKALESPRPAGANK